MKKGIISCLFLTILNIILCLMVSFTIEENNKTLVRIDPSNKELDFNGLRPRLTINEVYLITKSINADLDLLNPIKGILIFTTGCLIILLLWFIIKSKWYISSFDGLTLLIIAILSSGLHWLFILFNNKFENGSNATMNIRIWSTAALLIIQPILFLVAYKWNRAELLNKLHRQNWISMVSIILTILSCLITLIIGFGLLITPDLSGNIS